MTNIVILTTFSTLDHLVLLVRDKIDSTRKRNNAYSKSLKKLWKKVRTPLRALFHLGPEVTKGFIIQFLLFLSEIIIIIIIINFEV